MKHALGLSLILTAALVACGDGSPENQAPQATEATESPARTVVILEPADGSEVAGPTVTVRLDVSGVSILPAGDMTPGTGHHHLYLDADLTPPSEPVPSVEGSIVHMGDASATYTFQNVAPGEHRLIAVVADGAHFPLQPWVVDTVMFRVP